MKKPSRGPDNLAIDRAAGTFIQDNRAIPLSGIALYSRSGSSILNDYKRPGLRFEFNREHRNGAIMDAEIADSVFSRLFIRVQPDSTYFKPVINSPPYFQLWEVFGDSFNE